MSSEIIKGYPGVFAVAEAYHIMVQVKEKCTMWVKVGNEEYFDESNGVLKSDVTVHRMIVPKDELEKAGKYTICFRKIIKRQPYFSELEEMSSQEFAFKAVGTEEIRAYHIADAHFLVDEPVRAAQHFEELCGKMDFLILNGDVPEGSDCTEHFDGIYEICSRLTKGSIPVVFSRGNHDMRGKVAEKLCDYTPTDNGNSYFSFQLGNIWGLVADCGEDKPDEGEEYGGVICCHAFRKRQTKFIEKTVADREYQNEIVKHRVVVCHHPFTIYEEPPFDIEKELYSYWAKIIGENIKPEVMICGHKHTTEIIMPGDKRDMLGQPCPIVIGAKPAIVGDYEKCAFTGTGFIFKNDGIEVVFTDSESMICERHTLKTN